MSVRGLWRLWALVLIAIVLAWLMLRPTLSSDLPALVSARQPDRMPKLAPLPVPTDPAPALALLSQSTLWGPLPPRPASGAAGEAPPPPKWEVSGFYVVSGKRYVVVSFEKQALPSLQLTRGDRLPDGSRITRIEPDRVHVLAPQTDAGAGLQVNTAAQSKSSWLPITPGLDQKTRKQ